MEYDLVFCAWLRRLAWIRLDDVLSLELRWQRIRSKMTKWAENIHVVSFYCATR